MVEASNSVFHSISLASFNLHGSSQGRLAVTEIIDKYRPGIILLQEHWLTPANLAKLDKFKDYFVFASSAIWVML